MSGSYPEPAFSDFGHEVICVDKSRQDRGLEAGEVPIFEPGLEAIIAENRAPSPALLGNLAGPSRRPMRLHCGRHALAPRDGHADLSTSMRPPARSPLPSRLYRGVTSPRSPSARATRSSASSAKNSRKGHAVVSNPEFLRRGRHSDFKRPDRIVVGSDDERSTDVMRDLSRRSTSRKRLSTSVTRAPPN